MLNREAWLQTATTALRDHFSAQGYTIPANVRSTCGWPSKSATARKKRRIGECWSDDASDGKQFEIFISPTLADPLSVTETLAHELCHATVDLKAGHGAAFKRCATAIGLTGKMTSTTPGPAFKAWFEAQSFAPYPHETLNAMVNATKKQATRLIKTECPECLAEDAPYIVRASQSTLDRGAPYCPIHNVPMQA